MVEQACKIVITSTANSTASLPVIKTFSCLFLLFTLFNVGYLMFFIHLNKTLSESGTWDLVQRSINS